MKNSNDINGNRTRDLPACSAVPQQTAPQRAPKCSRFDVVEIARVSDMLPRLFPFLVRLRTYQHPGTPRYFGSAAPNMPDTIGKPFVEDSTDWDPKRSKPAVVVATKQHRVPAGRLVEGDTADLTSSRKAITKNFVC